MMDIATAETASMVMTVVFGGTALIGFVMREFALWWKVLFFVELCALLFLQGFGEGVRQQRREQPYALGTLTEGGTYRVHTMVHGYDPETGLKGPPQCAFLASPFYPLDRPLHPQVFVLSSTTTCADIAAMDHPALIHVPSRPSRGAADSIGREPNDPRRTL